jgi:chromosomal replication initiation ATPase DnaA
VDVPDDAHFLPGKVGPRRSCSTFNALYDANKQMVFTARPVSGKLSDRLHSRFGAA